MSAYSGFYIKPSEYEQVETVIHLKQESRPSLIGSIKDAYEKPVSDAFVAIFEAGDSDISHPAATTYTDEDGRFIFGPLEPEKLYIVRIYKKTGKIRQLEQPD